MFADTNNMRCFYSALKEIWGPKITSTSHIRTADDKKTLTKGSIILSTWAEHFRSLLNSPGNTSTDAFNRLRLVPTASWLDNQPDYLEVDTAIEQINDGKAPGTDLIPGDFQVLCNRNKELTS